MKILSTALVGGIMVFGMVRHSCAAESAPPAVVLEEVVVTASRLAETKKEQTVSIMVINRQEIVSSAARDVGDLLAEKGIGYIKKYPGGLTSIGIRGFKSDSHGNDLRGHILVLLDGRRAGTGNLAKISTDNIERLEIIRGPAAVQYGSAAMGGVVNVITRQGQGELAAKVSSSLGSYGASRSALSMAGSRALFDYAVSFARSGRDEYQDGNGETFYNTAIAKQDRYSANFGLTWADQHRLGLILTGSRSDQIGNPGYQTSNDLDNYKNAKLYSADLLYRASNNGNLHWLLRYFHGRDRDSWHDPVLSNVSGWDNGATSFQETAHQGAQAQASVELPWLRLTAGMDWVDYDMETSWTPEQTSYENLATFLLVKTTLFAERLIVDGGLRYDDYEVAMAQPVGNREDDRQWTPSLGLAYQLTSALQARLHYGQAFVMPGADQLAADYFTWGTHYLGNPDLKPESSRTWEAGLRYGRQTMTAEFSYFQTAFRDKIDTVTGLGTASWDNVGRARLSGVEGDLSLDLGALFDWPWEVKLLAGFVYHHTYRDEENHRDLKYINRWNGSYGLSVDDDDGLSARLIFAYNGPQLVDDRQSGLYPTPEAEMGGFTVATITARKRLTDFGDYGAVSLRAEIGNLFAKEYAYVKGYPMPGRLFNLGLDWEY